jgi:hypothetical protein
MDRHVLIDATEGVCLDGAVFEGRPAAGLPPWRVQMKSGHSGRSQGVQIVELDDGQMRIDVLPTRGMGIWRVRRGDKILGWRSPVGGPVHPAFVPLFDSSGLGWLEGFDELLCRCGLESNGAPDFDASGKLRYPLHGRIANLPAHRVELDVDEGAGQISLRGVVDETRFHFNSLRLTTTLTARIGSNEFSWTDEVENVGGRDATMQMLYHFNIGQPLLQPDSRITAPVATVAPHTQVAASEGVERWNVMPPPRPGSSEQVYLLDLLAEETGETRVLVSGLVGDEAVSLRFNKQALPCFTVWRNTPAEADGYVLGLEPGTNFPNPQTFEKQHGRVISLRPGGTWRADVTVGWHSDSQSIEAVETHIQNLQRQRSREFAAKPRSDWSANA